MSTFWDAVEARDRHMQFVGEEPITAVLAAEGIPDDQFDTVVFALLVKCEQAKLGPLETNAHVLLAGLMIGMKWEALRSAVSP